MDIIRVGFIGAGANTRSRHIPGLQAIDGVQVVCVANRSMESAKRVATEFNIPRVHAHWRDVVADPQVDAVCIGTWPYLHAPTTCAALAAGKHVLCEARMASSVADARLMLASSQQTDRVAMLVPSPFGLKGGRIMRELIASGYLGEIREIYVRGLSAQLADAAAPLHWRQRAELSGVNILSLGILNETVQRWFGRVESVVAQSSLFIPRRTDPVTGLVQDVDVPDSVTVLARQADGANAVYHVSGVAHSAGPSRVEAYGSAGTLVYNLADDTILGGQARGGTGSLSANGPGGTGSLSASGSNSEHGAPAPQDLSPILIPPDKAGGWRVEADFIDSIRLGKPVVFTSFADGLKYMQFTEAARKSADLGRRVWLSEV